jgi:hypothetical protein
MAILWVFLGASGCLEVHVREPGETKAAAAAEGPKGPVLAEEGEPAARPRPPPTMSREQVARADAEARRRAALTAEERAREDEPTPVVASNVVDYRPRPVTTSMSSDSGIDLTEYCASDRDERLRLRAQEAREAAATLEERAKLRAYQETKCRRVEQQMYDRFPCDDGGSYARVCRAPIGAPLLTFVCGPKAPLEIRGSHLPVQVDAPSAARSVRLTRPAERQERIGKDRACEELDAAAAAASAPKSAAPSPL